MHDELKNLEDLELEDFVSRTVLREALLTRLSIDNERCKIRLAEEQDSLEHARAESWRRTIVTSALAFVLVITWSAVLF